MSTFKRKSIDPKFVQEKFMAGELLARAHSSTVTVKNKKEINVDVSPFLNEIGGIVHASVDERQLGNRSASTSLLVPDLDSGLFDDIAFLHDIDQCTVRAYMYRDSVTTVKKKGGPFRNIEADKRNFVSVIDKSEFIEKYKKYYSENQKKITNYNHYNEVIANIFPESLIGMVLSTKRTLNLDESKFRLLAAKEKIKTEHELDLPLFLHDKGKLTEFNPSKKEILDIVNAVFRQKKEELGLDKEGLKKAHLDMLSQLGYELSNPNLELDQIKANHLWKKEFDIEAHEEFNIISDSASKALLTELQQLDPKEKQESIKIIENTIKQIKILRKTKVTSNTELQNSYRKLNDIIKHVSNEEAFQPTNVFKKAWNAIHVKIATLFKMTPTLLFKTNTKKILNLYQMHLKDISSNNKPNPMEPKETSDNPILTRPRK